MNLWTAWDPWKKETIEKRHLYQHVTGVFMAHHVYKWLSVYADDKMLWQIVTRILACQTSCDSCWFVMRMLSPQPVRTPGVFCQASVASWTLNKNFKDFQRPFESQFPPQEQKKKSAIEIKSAVPVSRPISTLSCDRISPSLLSLLWLDLCCLDTVHTAVRLGHSQAREESGVNGTRKTLFPKMYLFLNNLKWKEGVLL